MAAVPIKIPAGLFALAESSDFEGTFELDTLAAGPDDYHFAQPLPWKAKLTNTGAALLVEGTVGGRATASCSRCLERVDYDFEGEVEGYFLIEGADSPEMSDDDGELLGDDEFDVLPADHIIDLEPLLVAALLVDAPQAPLCRDDCAGLCPNCGANLNLGACGCAGDEGLAAFERAANPFAALADYRFED